MDYALAKKLIDIIMKKELDVINGIDQYVMVLMLRTGVEVKTKGGRTQTTYPIGINLKWLVAHLKGDQSPYQSVRFTGKHLDDLIARAEYDPLAWIAVNQLIDKFYDQKDPLPEQLYTFLRFNKAKPKKQGSHIAKNLYRDQCISECLCLLKKCNYFPITKSSSDSNPNSACHIIAEVLTENGIPIDYEGVKSIQYNYKEFYESVADSDCQHFI